MFYIPFISFPGTVDVCCAYKPFSCVLNHFGFKVVISLKLKIILFKPEDCIVSVAQTSILMLSSAEFFKDETLQGISRSIQQVRFLIEIFVLFSTVLLDLLQVSLLINKQMGGGRKGRRKREREGKGKESETCEQCVPKTRLVKMTGGFLSC